MNKTDGSERAPAGPLRDFFRFSDHAFVDYATEIYIAVAWLLILFFYRGSPGQRYFFLALNLFFLLAVQFLIRAHARWPKNRPLDLLRHLYPILLYAGLYCQVGELNHMFIQGYADDFFARLDERLFGCRPAEVFMGKLPYLPVSELFYACYFSYYVMISGLGVLFYIRDRQLFWHYISIVSFVFYVCYLVFILLPAAGPYVFMTQPYPEAVRAGPFFHIMKFIYAHAETPGGAFPSSHVAIALCTLYFSWRYLPRLRWIHAPMVVLLCGATVYCRYHYAVDVLGGALTAALLIPVGERLYNKFSRKEAQSEKNAFCRKAYDAAQARRAQETQDRNGATG